MPRTYQNVLDESRVLLQDSDSEAYRDTDEILTAKLNRALQELNRLRPDAFIDTFVSEDTVIPEVEVADLGDNFLPPMMFYTAVVYFVVGSAELKEDEFATDGRAATMLSMFREMVVGL